ncbi:lipopolysaccharide transport periplasmic protein LptA [Vandammella animalimorsus]|uniref:Lipopolysaccharide export system protein LptA n=1 Tax=Vandammella animalimorsus TaxID=2029117 RepID=A0A2A2T7N3_9BURK|nr:lipopolysaccharide transport periplasmic protein LptA [Vandammella animalimorsus]PAT31970.1 lipopolysaccharide transport periplasmic protein LptA [Vandammella animalimorsus]PAX17906.1 lipopolysaccharide transport periplasmic protein LptA [Vandammella animalimorsus]PAX20060.1 lipopolysaccharide transport periplasmic protein LptA [Vandammella animalimorsus]
MSKTLFLPLATASVVLLALALPQPQAHALASDRAQPMNIEADSLRHDEAKQTTVFTGRVVVTKGSIVLRGDSLNVLQRADGSQLGTVQAGGGRRAFFSQQRDTPKGAPKETVEAEATRIEYDSKADRVRLLGRAQLRRYQGGQLNDEISGGEIVYHNGSGQFSVDGAARGGSSSGSAPAGQGGRVRAVIGASTTGQAGSGSDRGSRGAKAPATPLAPSSELQQTAP